MNKMFIPLTLVLALMLAACGSAATGSASTGSSNAGNANQTLSKPAQLLVGTLKLEGTANAVDATEAASLLPLWQAYSQLINSNTAAQAEIDAVVAQIQEAMTKDQVQAITGMKLTRQDEFSVMSTLGLVPSSGTPVPGSTPQVFTFSDGSGGGFSVSGGPSGAGGPSVSGGPPAGGGAPPSGGLVVGGDLGGGGFPGAGGGASATQSATQLAARSANAGRISPMLMNALIELLQKRAGS